MNAFKVGGIYSMFSPCDQECIWTYIVKSRTACTITVSDGKEDKRLRINKQASEIYGAETVYPLGRYSMAPSLTAYA